MAAAHPQFNFQTPLWLRRSAWLWMAIVAYGSLFPLDWDFDSPNKFGWFEHLGRLDIVKNILLFMPLGALVALLGNAAARRSMHLLLWTVAAFSLALLLQVAQIYLPRDPEAADVLTNMIGFFAGYWLQPLAARVHAAVHRHGRITGADPFLLVLAVIWVFATMFPFIPVWRAEMFHTQLAELLQLDWNKPRQLVLQALLTFIGLSALNLTVRELPRIGRYAQIVVGFAVIAAVEAKVIGFSQVPSFAALLGILLGVCAWFARSGLHKTARQQSVLLGCSGLLMYLIYAVLPLNFRSPVFFQWWPFGSLLGGGLTVVLRSYCTEALGLGVMMWAMTQFGWRIRTATCCAALIGFSAEWLQRYLEYRTPEIGTVIMVLVLAFLMKLCCRTEDEVSALSATQGHTRSR